MGHINSVLTLSVGQSRGDHAERYILHPPVLEPEEFCMTTLFLAGAVTPLSADCSECVKAIPVRGHEGP
jgi:hypothetical protein